MKKLLCTPLVAVTLAALSFGMSPSAPAPAHAASGVWFDANGPQADLKEPPSTVKQRRIATANADKLLQTLVTKKRLKGLKLDTPVALKPAKKRVTMKLLGGKEDDHHDR